MANCGGGGGSGAVYGGGGGQRPNCVHHSGWRAKRSFPSSSRFFCSLRLAPKTATSIATGAASKKIAV